MAYPTLEEVKNYLGVTTGDDDALIQQIIDQTIALLENYLGRNMVSATFDHESYMPESNMIQLKNYPTKIINSITLDGEAGVVEDYHVSKDIGTIYGDFNNVDVVEINYDGGYDPLPLDYEQVFYQVVSDVYDDYKGVSDSDVKDVTLFDFAKVSYDTSTTTTGGSRGGTINYSGVGAGNVPAQLEPYLGVLNMYKSNLVMMSSNGGGH